MTPEEIYQAKLNEIFGGFENDTIIFGKCVYHLVQCEFDKIDEILYDGAAPNGCRIAKKYNLSSMKEEISVKNSIFAHLTKVNGNVVIKPFASTSNCYSYDTCIKFLKGTVNLRKHFSISFYVNNQRVRDLLNQGNYYPIQNYIKDTKAFKTLEKSMPIIPITSRDIFIEECNSFEERLQKVLGEIPEGNVIFGESIRKLLSDTKDNYIHVQYVDLFKVKDLHQPVQFFFDVDSLFGEVLRYADGRKDVFINGSMIDEETEENIIELIKNKQIKHSFDPPDYLVRNNQGDGFLTSTNKVTKNKRTFKQLYRSLTNNCKSRNTISDIYNKIKEDQANSLKKAADIIAAAKQRTKAKNSNYWRCKNDKAKHYGSYKS